MSRIVDDDPPIKTHAANQAYRDNWDRIFGEPEPERFVTVDHFCATCEALVADPDVHLAQGHALLNTTTNEVLCTRADEPACDGFYDDGVMPTRCQNREGCGRTGCPANDFGSTP